MTVRIRNALPTDLGAVSLIEDDSFPSSPYPLQVFTKLLQDHADSFFIAEETSGKVVGYCVAIKEGKSAHLISIAVLETHRGEGVGTALLQYLIDYFDRLEVDELWLEVNTWNREAMELYQRLGFAKVMILDNYYSDGAPALRMRLDLNEGVRE